MIAPHPAEIPSPPEGFVTLGAGGSFFIPDGLAFEAVVSNRMGDEWSQEYTASGINPNLIYAARANSRVVRYNLPPLTEDFEVVGYGNRGNRWRERCLCYNPRWQEAGWQEDVWNGTSDDRIYARRTSNQRNNNMTRLVNFEHRSTFGIDAPPDGYVILGPGGTFETNGAFPALRASLDRFSGWTRDVGAVGRNEDRIYAVAPDSQTLKLNLPEFPQWWEDAVVLGYAENNNDIQNSHEAWLVMEKSDARWTVWNENMQAMNPDWLVAAKPLGAQQPAEIAARAVRQWSLMVGSDLVEPENIAENISGLLSNQDNLNRIASALDEALRVSDPEAAIEEWIDREPGLLASIEFVPISSTGGVDIHAVAESTAPISDVIIKAAAGVMLRGGLSDHFRYLEDGTLTIDPSNPPTVEHAYEMLKRTLETKETASKLENYSAWMLGMIADQFEGYFQDRFDPSVIMAQTSRAYNTYICSLKTFRSWWNERRPNLSFTHHREVEYAKHLTHEKAGQVLDISSRFNLTVLQQRKVISYARNFDLLALQQEMEEQGQDGVEDLMERIDIRAVNKRYIFFLRSANRWYAYKGPFENIPNGASPIINADTREVMQQDGRATKPDEWVPVGVELARAATMAGGATNVGEDIIEEAQNEETAEIAEGLGDD